MLNSTNNEQTHGCNCYDPDQIKTIFYFVDDLPYDENPEDEDNSYLTMLRRGKISQRTIVFADKQRAIYKGGLQYCPIAESTVKVLLQELLSDEEIEALVVAILKKYLNDTPDVNLINAVLNVVKNWFRTSADRATKESWGVVRVGDFINVDDGTISVNYNTLFGTSAFAVMVK